MINSICNDKPKLAAIRSRLSDISWWMRLPSQNIAQPANREDQEFGKFWQGRFRAQVLLDDPAILACRQYVDLNPIRAGIAVTPETSDFTSVQERMADACGECSVFGFRCSESSMGSGESPASPGAPGSATFSPAAGEKGRNEEAPSFGLSATFSPAAGEKGREETACGEDEDGIENGPRAGWLSPVPVDPPRKKVREEPATRRASNRGILPMSLDEYLRLLDWTGRQLRRPVEQRGKGKTGKIPENCAPILDRLECSAETWLDFVQNFRKRFRVEAGLPQSLRTFRSFRQSRRTSAAAS